MTKNSREIILGRLKYFEENLRYLEEIKKNSWLDLKQNHHQLAAMMYYLYILISSILDIGSHILVTDFKETPESYRDVLLKLYERKLISEELFKRNEAMPSFRNHLAHQYESINLDQVYHFVQEYLDDLKMFGRIFAEYLEKK